MRYTTVGNKNILSHLKFGAENLTKIEVNFIIQLL